MEKPWRAQMMKPPSDTAALVDCTLEQLWRMKSAFSLTLEFEGKNYDFIICNEDQLKGFAGRGKRVVTFREMRELFKIATYQRILHGSELPFAKFLELIDFARESPLDLVLAEVELVREPCTSSSTNSGSATDADTSSSETTDEGPSAPTPVEPANGTPSS